jgi:hypothetical protein
MVRKQLYLEETQDQALKHRAKELGVSEAELVRLVLDSALKSTPQTRSVEESEVLNAIFADADTIAKTHRFADSYRFDRQALVEEDDRQARWK